MSTQPVRRLGLQLANRVMRPLDALAASRIPGNNTPIMVVGLPRSGTTLVYELLVQAFDVAFLTPIYDYTYGLPNMVTRLVAGKIGNPVARYSSDYGRIPGRFAPAENATIWGRWFPQHAELGHLVPRESISEQARHESEALLSSMSAIARRPYLFKNVYMTLSLPAFLRLVPKSRVIVVRRNIEAVIASVYNKRQTLSSWWSIRPPFARDVYNKGTLEQSAFQCVRSEQILNDALATLPQDRCLMVDYESICTAPRKFVDQAANWVGSDFHIRPDGEIPDNFMPSKGPGLDAELAMKLSRYMNSLESGRERYLSRVQTAISKIGADDSD